MLFVRRVPALRLNSLIRVFYEASSSVVRDVCGVSVVLHLSGRVLRVSGLLRVSVRRCGGEADSVAASVSAGAGSEAVRGARSRRDRSVCCGGGSQGARGVHSEQVAVQSVREAAATGGLAVWRDRSVQAHNAQEGMSDERRSRLY
ncbi:MAG: hypothetical protein QXX12_00065 [Nanopusillaceae archaeon]